MDIDNYINNIIEGNCVEVMRNFDDNVIDLTITSPPYDDLRNYNGYVFPFLVDCMHAGLELVGTTYKNYSKNEQVREKFAKVSI